RVSFRASLRHRFPRSPPAARKRKRKDEGKPSTIGELTDAVASLGGTNGITATFGGGRGEQRVFGDPTRLVRGKIDVKVRVAGGHRRRRR
ncbi:MAG: hypothetical protein ACR2NH_00960, partial [Solirubrobacteraceae bacterium]